MLSPHDAAFVARDPTLPGLALLLDPVAFRTALTVVRPDIQVRKVEAIYVRYKPETNCLVKFRLTITTDQATTKTTIVYAVAYPDSKWVKLDGVYTEGETEHLLGSAPVVLEEAAVVIYSFPCDRRLKALPRLFDAKQRLRLLKRTLPNQPGLWEAQIVPMRYKPERRFVARLEADQTYALLKLYSKNSFGQAKNSRTSYVAGKHLYTARSLGYSERYCLQVLEWLDGLPLDNLLFSQQNEGKICPQQVMKRAGMALAELHGQTYGTSTKQGGTMDGEAQTMSRAILSFAPHLARQVHEVAKRVTTTLDTLSEQPGCVIHGDFSADQVLVGERDSGAHRVAILDLDRAGWGDPASDVGSFIANLNQLSIAGCLSEEQVKSWTRALVKGYHCAAAWTLGPERIQIQTAIRLLRLVPEPFRLRWPNWYDATEEILQRVEEVIDDESTGYCG